MQIKHTQSAAALRVISVCLLWCVCSFSTATSAAGEGEPHTLPGTMIENRAELSYINADTGESVSVVSNLSAIAVGHYYNFSVDTDQHIGAESGDVLGFTHRITNTGNTDDSYLLDLLVSGDEDLSDSVAVYHDTNGNGIVDSGEQVITASVMLGPGESIDVVVVGVVPMTARIDSVIRFTLSVESTGSDTEVQSVVDEVIVEAGEQLELFKTSAPACAVHLFAGDQVTHSVSLRNSGSSSADGIHLLVDGIAVVGVVVQHPVAAEMSFQHFQSQEYTSGAMPVVRLAGVAENSWIHVANWRGDVPVVSAGLFFTPQQLPVDASEQFTVVHTVRESTSSTSLITSAASVDFNGDEIIDDKSNNTCQTLSVPNAVTQASLRFLEPAQSLQHTGAVPLFEQSEDFVDAIHYRIQGVGGDSYLPSRDGFYLELALLALQDAAVSLDAAGNRYAIAEVESQVTGDHIQVVMLETATPGLFRSVAPVALSMAQHASGGVCPKLPDAGDIVTPVIADTNDNCVLATGYDDMLQGRFLDSGSGYAIADVALVNPQATVFNSQTLLPVAGAVVSVRLAATDEIASNSVTGEKFQITTGADGLYTLPRLLSGVEYYLHVDPPASHLFPSAATNGVSGNYTVTAQSYGRHGNPVDQLDRTGVFRIEENEIFQPADIPLDSNLSDVLLSVEKTALQQSVELGQSVGYQVTIKNRDDSDLSSVLLEDRPPYGFRYVKGSARIDDVSVVDPVRTASGLLQFDIGTLTPGETLRITYVLRSSAAAIDGDGVNMAVARGVTTENAMAVSPASRTKVALQRHGVLSDRAALFGKIYVDQNCDGIQNDKEWPVGGVKFYLHDGTYTISDADGLFSVYGLAPGSHVIKVDTHSLPQGLELKPLDSHHGVDPESRFVDLMQGDFHRVDFAATCPADDRDRIFAEIKARNQSINGNWLLKEAENFRAGEELQQLDSQSLVRTADGDLSSGVLDGPGDGRDERDGLVSRRVVEALAAQKVNAAEQIPDPTQIVTDITQAQAKAGTWLWPLKELSIDGRFMAVVRNGIEPTLYVNGIGIPATQIGERIANRREKAQVVAWYGVELDSGENIVEVKGVGPFGNERVLATGTFKRPSTGVSIRLSHEQTALQADGGRSILPVKVEILDKFGYPALGVYFITLESSDGGFVEQDIQDSEPGRQIRVSDGVRTVNYISSDRTGEVLVRASTGDFSDETTLHQVSESRSLIATGFVEAGASFSLTNFGDFAPSQNLGDLDGTSRFNSRAALFVKGRVKENYNLTLSYDSDKDSKEALLRDINPSVHYPIHGDASVRGYEAQSRSKLYFKLERDKNSLMWGDYLTDSNGDHHDLARARRTFTGLNTIYDDDNNRLRLFAAEQENRRINELVPGNGSAMLYRLKSFPIIPNSEVVELITQSRDNPGLVVAQTRLSRFGDYTIDPVDGYVTFSSVIPTLDDQQNPVFVRIGYDLEDGGDNYLVSGLRFDRTVSENLKFGASFTNDQHDEDGNRLIGAYAAYEAGRNTRVTASVATSDSVQNVSGTAMRLSAEHQWGGKAEARTSFTHARADAGFTNSGAAVAAGRSETRFNHKQKVMRNANLTVDAIQSDSTDSSEGRRSFSAMLESRLRDWLVRAGLRQVTQEDFAGKDSFVTSLLGVNRKISIGDKVGSIDAEIEQDTGKASRRRVTVGGKLQVHEKAHVYSNYELSNSLLTLGGVGNNQESETLTLGVESKLLPSTRLYSEYRMRGAFDSRDHETASGIRADYELSKNLKVTPSFEFVKTIDATTANDSIAASVAVVDTRNANSRRLARLETRRTDTSDYVGLRASYAARMNEDWTAVITENLSRQSNRGTDDTLRHSFVAGLTRRPKLNNRHHMLLMYNWKEEKGVTAGSDRSVHLLSTHQNLQLNNHTLLTGRLGGKRHTTRLQNQTATSFTLLADVRLNFDFNRRVNIDLRGGILATDSMSELRYSAGAGIYYLLNKNARIGVGYNLAGFRDEDLDAEEYNAHGWHLGLQYKFDEDSLKWLQ